MARNLLSTIPLEDTYKKLGDDLLPLYHAMQMRADHPIQFVMSQSQQREFFETYSGILCGTSWHLQQTCHDKG